MNESYIWGVTDGDSQIAFLANINVKGRRWSWRGPWLERRGSGCSRCTRGVGRRVWSWLLRQRSGRCTCTSPNQRVWRSQWSHSGFGRSWMLPWSWSASRSEATPWRWARSLASYVNLTATCLLVRVLCNVWVATINKNPLHDCVDGSIKLVCIAWHQE